MTVDAGQLELAQRQTIRPLLLMTLTTYTDRLQSTVDQVWRFSDVGVSFDAGDGAGVQEWIPLVESISPLRHEISHLSGPNDGARLWNKPLQVRLINWPIDGGETLFRQLRSQNIENARVRVFELLLPDVSRGVEDTDLGPWAGRQTPIYSGVVTRMRDKTEDGFTLEMRFEIPALDRDIVNTTDADGRSVGRLANDVYGFVAFIPCLGYGVGETEPLVDFIDNAATTIPVADATDFPTSGTIMIGRERIDYTGTDTVANTLTGASRGVDGTVAVGHWAGELVVSMISDDTKYLIARHQMESVENVYVRSPLDDRLFRIIPGQDCTVSLQENTDVPDGMTGPVAVVKFSPGQIRTLIDRFYAQAEYAPTPDQTFSDDIQRTWHGASIANQSGGTAIYPTTLDYNSDCDLCIASETSGTITHQQVGIGNAFGSAYQWRGMTDYTEPGVYVSRFRFRIEPELVQIGNQQPRQLRVQVMGFNMTSLTADVVSDKSLIQSQDYTGTQTDPDPDPFYTPWFTCLPGLNLSNFNGDSSAPNWVGLHVGVYVSDDFYNGQGNFVDIPNNGVYLETERVQPGDADPRSIDANSATRFQAGQGLEVFATGGGVLAPDDNYQAAEGLLLQSTEDIARHILCERAGFPQAAVIDSGLPDEVVGTIFAYETDQRNVVTYNASTGQGPTGYKDAQMQADENTASAGTGLETTLQSNQSPSEQGAVYNYSPTHPIASNPEIVKRWRLTIVGDFRGSTANPARLEVRFGNFPDGNGYVTNAGEGLGSVKNFEIPGSENSTWVNDYTIQSPINLPTALVTIDQFASINSTTWDGMHLALWMTDRGSTGDDGVIKSVTLTFEVIKRGFVQQDMGTSIPAVLGRLGYESGAQLIPFEGASGLNFKWSFPELYPAPGDFQWVVNTGPITEWSEAIENTRELDSIGTRWRFYDFPNRARKTVTGDPVEYYERVIEVDSKKSDLAAFPPATMAALEQKVGEVETEPNFFVSTYGTGSEYVAEYIVATSIEQQVAEVQLAGVPWSQAYEKTVGDVFELQLDDWTSTRKMRVIGLEKDIASGLYSIACVEVK